MTNNYHFIERLKIIVNKEDLTASLFADKIGVQRSSISHILSGRNKPSLDFILKVVQTFDDVDINWLLNGKGKYPKDSSPTPPQSLKNEYSGNLFESDDNKKIDRIVVFFNDGTFSEYQKA